MKRTNTAVWLDKYNRWQIKVQKDGVRKTFTSPAPGRNGQRECNRKADDWLDENIDRSRDRVSALAEEWLKAIEDTTSTGNHHNEQSICKTWLIPNIGNLRISQLNEGHLQAIINKASKAGRSKKTLTNIRASIMNFLKFCRINKATTLFPENLQIPKSAPRSAKKILQPADLAKVFATDTTVMRKKRVFEPYIYMWRFQILTGLRPGETRHLKWSDIDGDNVYTQGAMNIRNELTTGKNENAIRHFALTALAQQVLKDQKSLGLDGEYIFPAPVYRTYSNRWAMFCEHNSIPHVAPYEMRHTFVSVGKNLPAGQMKRLVGHSKNMDTFGVYGHELRGEMKQTAAQLNELFDAIIADSRD